MKKKAEKNKKRDAKTEARKLLDDEKRKQK